MTMITTLEPPAFDVCGALPTGTTVLEASAGTGKTYTIAALATRYVADGVDLDRLMMVTFGRMATDELRQRVRERMVASSDQLAAVLHGQPLPADADDLARLLTTGPIEELTQRRRRLSRALSDFDAATIATTHEFCLRMLDGLGVLGDREPHAVFVEQLTDLTAEVARDVFLRRYAFDGDAPLSFDQARQLARQVVEAAHTRLVPGPEDDPDHPDRAARRRVAYAHEVRAELQRRKDAARLFSYDDMLTRLRDALAHPAHGDAAAARLRQRYRVVLVDEFQDTDPVQWEILRRAFHGHSTLIMIGDPKQAIYAFRGADVYSYLDAVRQADRVATLAVNWRSDQAVVDALDRLMGGASLGDPAIVVREVRAYHQDRRLPGDAAGDGRLRPLRLRVLPREPDSGRLDSVSDIRPRVEADLVADITRLLHRGQRLSVDAPSRPVVASDIAVLVRRNERGESIRDALVAAGVPAVMLGSTSVFATAVAADWLTLLTALEQPRQASARNAALTCFLGWTVADLALADEAALTGLSHRIRWWSRVLNHRGVAALVEAITVDGGLAERLLGQVGGERLLTDFRHVGQALHAAMTSGRLGVSALVDWLTQQMAEARSDTLTDGTRRLETDAEAVQILTVHRSKGLQFPIVYLPEAWDQYVFSRDDGRVLRLHADGGCVLDVGGLTGAGRQERLARHQHEEAGEELRLLYVAATRAQCQVVTWWAASANTPCSALHRFLFRDRGVVEPARSYPLPDEPVEALDLGPGISVEPVEPRAPVSAGPVGGRAGDLTVRRFERDLDLRWRRTSYSALTAAAHGLDLGSAAVGSEAEVAKEDDESVAAVVVEPSVAPAVPADGLEQASPMQDLPSGVQFGTLVHAVLEAVDPIAADLRTELRRAAAAALGRTQASLTDDVLADALLPTLQTPLGPLADDRRLADIPGSDRLAELVFELPLAGGEHTTADVTVAEIAPMLRRHLGPGDPLVSYPDQLDHPVLADQTLRGYLTGSIDAVLRVGADPPRYLVVDYKTNWLGEVDGPVLTLGDYRPDRLARAMIGAHYPLQALLYSAALHRMLRWRQPGYAPETHLGGVLYLFVRGMAGEATPRVDGVPCGVFSWRPPPALVVELSDLLDGGPR